MQFNSHATEQDLVSETRRLCDADSTSYTTNDITRRINTGYELLIGKIIGADGLWEFDDTNFTDLPRGTGDLVEGQEAYTFAATYLNLRMVEVLDAGSPAVYRRLKPIDELNLDGMGPEEYFGLETSGDPLKGMPEWYSKEGDTIRIYPAPTSTAVTLTAGIRIWFQRTADLFTTSDTTQEPGIPSPYHILLAYYAAIPYCMAYKKDRVEWLELKWIEGTQDLLNFYGRRSRDERKVMTNKKIRYV